MIARAGDSGPVSHFLRTVSVDAAEIAANTTGDTAATVPGAEVGDTVIATCDGALEAGLVVGNARVTAANTVSLRLGNVTVAPVNASAFNFRFLVLKTANLSP